MYRPIITQCIYESLPFKKNSSTFRLLQFFRKLLSAKTRWMQVPSISPWEASFCPRLRKLKLAPVIKKEANKMITKQRRESTIGLLVVVGSIPFNLKHNFSYFSSSSYSKVEAAREYQIEMQLTKTVRPDMEFVKWQKWHLNSNYSWNLLNSG